MRPIASCLRRRPRGTRPSSIRFLFDENADLNVGAALLRGDVSRPKDDRRSEIGSHIFMGGGAPNRRMWHFHEGEGLAKQGAEYGSTEVALRRQNLTLYKGPLPNCR